jgi:hypothetical protein
MSTGWMAENGGVVDGPMTGVAVKAGGANR